MVTLRKIFEKPLRVLKNNFSSFSPSQPQKDIKKHAPINYIHTCGEMFSCTRKYNSMRRGVIAYLLETIANITEIVRKLTVQENKIKNKLHFNLFKVNTTTNIAP